MQSFSHRPQNTTSLPFLIALALLLLNDFYWKAAYGSFWTGKISDFAGLFVFVIFWSTLFVKRKATVYFLTAIIFIWWKSPFSQAFIVTFGQIFYPIERVVDMTDLWALLVLPLAFYFVKSVGIMRFNLSLYLVGGVVFFAFCATSYAQIHHKVERPQYVLFHDLPIIKSDSYHGYCHSVYFTIDTVADDYLLFNPYKILSRSPQYEDDYTYVEFCRNLPKKMLCDYIENDSLRFVLASNLLLSGEIQLLGYEKDSINLENLSFKDGRLHGEYQRWRKDSTTVMQGQYENGIETGTWNFYDKNGDLERKVVFSKGEKILEELVVVDKVYHTKTFITRSQTIQKHFWLLLLEMAFAILFFYFFIRNQWSTSYKSEAWKELSWFNRLLLSLISIVGAIILYFTLLSYIPILQKSASFPIGIIVLCLMALPIVLLGTFQVARIKNYTTAVLIILIAVTFLLIIDQGFFIEELM